MSKSKTSYLSDEEKDKFLSSLVEYFEKTPSIRVSDIIRTAFSKGKCKISL